MNPNIELLKCAFCGAEQRSDQDGCSGWAVMDVGGRRFYFCPAELAKPGAPAEEFSAAKKRCQTRVLELLGQQRCRVCGCSNDRACTTPEGPCHWIEEDLCSRCGPSKNTPAFNEDDKLALAGCPPIVLELEPAVAFHLLATIQLACRHPGMQGNIRFTAVRVALSLQDLLSLTPNLEALCAAGWDESMDVSSRTANDCGAEPGAGIITPGSSGWFG